MYILFLLVIFNEKLEFLLLYFINIMKIFKLKNYKNK